MRVAIKKPSKKQVSVFLRYLFFIILGNAVTAAGSAFFLVPHNFVMGGVTGLGIFVRNLIPETVVWREWAVQITVYALNIVLFVIGTIFLGKRFAAATLAGTLLYPTFMSLFKVLNELIVAWNGGAMIGATNSGDVSVLAVFCGAGLYGVGTALVMRVGASTGGTDIPPLILNKYFGLSISGALWGIDLFIIVLQFAAHATINDILWGVIISLLTSVVLEVMLPVGSKRVQVKIVSKRYKEIREMILTKLDRGVTLFYGQTGYLQEKCFVVMTVVSKRELVKLKEETQKIDPDAFLTVGIISEVRGRGFTADVVHLTREQAEEDLTEVSMESLE